MKNEKLTKSEPADLSGVSRQFLYYRHIQCEKDWNLKVKIEEVLRDFPSYGYRRIAKHLKMNRKSVQRVMKFFGLGTFHRRGRKPKKKQQ